MMSEQLLKRYFIKKNTKKVDVRKAIRKCLKFNKTLQEQLKQYITLIDLLIEQQRKTSSSDNIYSIDETTRYNRIYYKTYFPSDFYQNSLHKNNAIYLVDNMKEILGATFQWNVKALSSLHHGVQTQNMKLQLTPLLEKLKRISRKKSITKQDVDEANTIKANVDIIKNNQSDEKLKVNVTGLDFNKISSKYLPKINAIRCQLRWITQEHPYVNHNEWLYSENLKLKELGEKFNEKNWSIISKDMDNGKSPIQCLVQYSSKLDGKLTENDLTNQDIQLIRDILWEKNLEFELFSDDNENIDINFIYQYILPYLPNKSLKILQSTVFSLAEDVKSNTWSCQLDFKLYNLRHLYPEMSWKTISSKLKTNKSARQCQLRYENYLSLNKNVINMTDEEQQKLIDFFYKNSFEDLNNDDFNNIISGKGVCDIKKCYFFLMKNNLLPVDTCSGNYNNQNNNSNNNNISSLDMVKPKFLRLDTRTVFHRIKIIESQNFQIDEHTLNSPDTLSNYSSSGSSPLFYYNDIEIKALTEKFFTYTKHIFAFYEQLRKDYNCMPENVSFPLLFLLQNSLNILLTHLHPYKRELLQTNFKYALLERLSHYPFKSYETIVNNFTQLASDDTAAHTPAVDNENLFNALYFDTTVINQRDLLCDNNVSIDSAIDHYFGYLLDTPKSDCETNDLDVDDDDELPSSSIQNYQTKISQLASMGDFQSMLDVENSMSAGSDAVADSTKSVQTLVDDQISCIDRLLYHNECLLILSTDSHFIHCTAKINSKLLRNLSTNDSNDNAISDQLIDFSIEPNSTPPSNIDYSDSIRDLDFLPPNIFTLGCFRQLTQNNLKRSSSYIHADTQKHISNFIAKLERKQDASLIKMNDFFYKFFLFPALFHHAINKK